MDELSRKILTEFNELGQDTLDLHALMEAGGNEPKRRNQIVDLVAELVRDGMLQEMGSDYYAITELGRKASGQA